MKHLIIFFACFFASLTNFAQEKNDDHQKRMKYGFQIGTNLSALQDQVTFPVYTTFTNQLGFHLGILAEYQLFDFMAIAPKAGLAFNNSGILYTTGDSPASKYELMPVSLDFKTHFIFKKSTNNFNPYLLVGPSTKIPIDQPTEATSFGTGYDFVIDFGIGLEKPFSKFNFAPELTYSYGLMNINQNPVLQEIKMHYFSLNFNFTGS